MNNLKIYDDIVENFMDSFVIVSVTNNRDFLEDFPIVCKKLFESSLIALAHYEVNTDV